MGAVFDKLRPVPISTGWSRAHVDSAVLWQEGRIKKNITTACEGSRGGCQNLGLYLVVPPALGAPPVTSVGERMPGSALGAPAGAAALGAPPPPLDAGVVPLVPLLAGLAATYGCWTLVSWPNAAKLEVKNAAANKVLKSFMNDSLVVE